MLSPRLLEEQRQHWRRLRRETNGQRTRRCDQDCSAYRIRASFLSVIGHARGRDSAPVGPPGSGSAELLSHLNA
jgi:hypothetical protein